MPRRETKNKGVVNGNWGEAVAAEFLRRSGFEILDSNSRPVRRDRRLEIDIVARDKVNDTLVFVEVKQHARMSAFQRRIRSVDLKKKMNLRRACNAWRRIHSCTGSFRFDVVEVYGSPGEKPCVDHISNVRLFVPDGRFVKWG